MRPQPTAPGHYDLYPTFPLDAGQVQVGYESLARQLPERGAVIVDGYAGVFWEPLRQGLDAALRARGKTATWIHVADAMRSDLEIDTLIAPFMGGNDPLFGTRFTGRLEDFFDAEKLRRLATDSGSGLTIYYGCGAALVGLEGCLVYVDLPKNELQFRSRAGSVTNLGARRPAPPKAMYKRFYFVDWPALNAHKKELLARVDYVVDGQRPDEPVWIKGAALRAGLAAMAHNYFRVRPWFEPGPWGGQWCKRRIQGLPEAPNYAWSFELIVPENGLCFASDGLAVEVSFDWLMFGHAAEVLGDCAARFGDEFPIRFDFLDTFDGGNLSVQVHPHPDYIRAHFGERFTQDETYYILDAGPDATVNLGFQDGVQPEDFRAALERSYRDASPLDVARYVQSFPSRKHDLFLIPHGTIHGSGIDNLVLEISATPYIFTFKLYDWLRPDLDGRPRPLNIERGMANLDFTRCGARVPREHISQPKVLQRGADCSLEHLPTHPDHFYDVYRYRFAGEFQARTDGSAHVMSVVEGRRVRLETAGGRAACFNYAETFVVPAAAESYRLINEGPDPAVVVMARMK